MGNALGGEGLVAAAAALAAAMAQGRSEDELGLLAAFFTVLGDNLALLALQAPGEDQQPSRSC
jgi:hypothetical protein